MEINIFFNWPLSHCSSAFLIVGTPWGLGPKAGCRGIVLQLQADLDTVRANSPTSARSCQLPRWRRRLCTYIDAQARHKVTCLYIHGKLLGWKTRVQSLGLTLDHRVGFHQAAKKLRARAQLATSAVRKMAAGTTAVPER